MLLLCDVAAQFIVTVKVIYTVSSITHILSLAQLFLLTGKLLPGLTQCGGVSCHTHIIMQTCA